MQRFRADKRVPAQHFPILVAGDQRDLLDGEAGLEQAACAFMAQIVEIQVLHADLDGGAPEGCTDRFRVIGKDPSVGFIQMLGLFSDQRPGIEAGGREKGDPLVVAGLVAWVFSVADHEHSAVDVEIGPFDAANFVEPHGRGHRELRDACHRQGQAFVVIEATEEAVQLVRGRATIPLCALADQAETLERDARQIDGFRRDVQAVHSRRMGDDHLDHADVDPERHRARTLLRTHLAVVDWLLPVEVPDLLLAQIALERRERGGLSATRRFPYLAHIGYIKVNEVTKGLEAGNGRLVRRQPLIDPGLRLAGPAMGVVTAEERLVRVAAFSSDLDRGQAPEGSLVMEAIFVCAMCAMSRRKGANSGILGRIPT